MDVLRQLVSVLGLSSTVFAVLAVFAARTLVGRGEKELQREVERIRASYPVVANLDESLRSSVRRLT